jgi:glycosyltransferase involved in cell wall biosynthesis
MDKPFFTVVIPTHNRGLLLKRAVDSVINQTFHNFEVIIVDDHSTDDTSTMVKTFSDKRIQYKLNQRSKGACGARNTGIYAAKGQWVAFLDDDDVWYDDKLKYQYELISKSESSVGLICTDYVIYKGENKLKVIKNRPSGWVRKKILYGDCIGCLSSTCVRRDILINIDGFDESFPACQDQDLWFRVAEISEFAFVPKTLVYMYQEKRERIGQNHKNKLYGYIMLRNKFINTINPNIRIKCRYESNIFIYSFLLKQKYFFRKSFPWFLLGIIADFPYCLNHLRKAALLFYRSRKNFFYMPGPEN